MTTTADVERALAAAGLVAPVDWQEVTASTNATALRMAEADAPQWSLAAAAHQTAGRGRLGRAWEDRPGRALMFSVVLRPAMSPDAAGILPLLAGAAMAEAGSAVSGLKVRCKWPNDLLVDAGKDAEKVAENVAEKVGGILAESEVRDCVLRHVVMGVGVNLDAPPGIEGAAGLGPEVDPLELLSRFLISFRSGYEPGDAEAMAARWSAASATIGREVEATSQDGSRITGTATGVNARGALIVRTATGSIPVSSGELLHLR
jgi:BirA family biotin operon repressor/biotin-[acetyl-CoA-carboxylase] ligase